MFLDPPRALSSLSLCLGCGAWAMGTGMTSPPECVISEPVSFHGAPCSAGPGVCCHRFSFWKRDRSR